MAYRHKWAAIPVAMLAALLGSVPVSAESVTVTPPEKVGMSKERLDRITTVFKAEIDKGEFPGAVIGVVRKGQLVYFESLGYRDPVAKDAMPANAIFAIASMTKPMVSIAIMMLRDEGKLLLSDPVGKFIPALADMKVGVVKGDTLETVAAIRQPTVQDLLRHTAGFVYSTSAPSQRIKDLYNEHGIEARGVSVTGDEMLRRLGTIPLAWQPGTQFHYSICTDVLGLLVERVAGQRLDTIIAERITGPLGMRDTAWFVTPDKRARVAEALDADPLKASMWRSYRIEQDLRAESYLKGGAGMVSTAADYVRFAQMIADGGVFEGRRLLSPAAVRLMLSNHTAGMGGSPVASTGPGYGFGLGFAVRLADGMAVVPGSPGDAMWAGAWGTVFTIDRAEGLVAVLMTQGPSTRTHSRMLFKALVYGAIVESARNGNG